MASTYATTIQKLKAIKLRIARLSDQLVKEADAYDAAFAQLQTDLTDQLGQGIQLLPEGCTKQLPMKHDVVLRRIVELRKQQYSFPDIATRLNVESHKLPNVSKFTGDVVKSLFDQAAS